MVYELYLCLSFNLSSGCMWRINLTNDPPCQEFKVDHEKDP